MRFIYFYSPTYQFYHEHIQSCLKDHFELEAIQMEDIPESNPNGHQFLGLTIKLELVLSAIQKYKGETIVFSDATIFINANKSSELKPYIEQYRDHDLVFINEFANGLNIGLLTIQCSDLTLDFFTEVLHLMRTNQYQHDQVAINKLIESQKYPLKYTVYGERIFLEYFRENRREDFLIFKSFVNNRGKISNFNQRIQQFYNYKLIDQATYDKWLIQ